MRWKKLGKTLLVAAVSFAIVCSLAFGTFVYNPFEGGFGEIRAAVPTDVDFYIAKRDLADDFDEFPRPRFWDSFRQASWWPRLEASRLFRSIAAGAGPILRQVEDLDARLRRVPLVGLDILDDGIGRDLVVAGKLRAGGEGVDVCAYSRVSWKVLAGVGLLAYDFVRSAARGVAITPEDEGLYRIEAPGAEAVFLTRVKDLVICGSALPLVRESRDLALGRSDKDVVFASADYNDDLVRPLAEWRARTGQTNAAETMVDFAVVRRAFPEFAAWPGHAADTTIEQRLLDAFINQSAMRRLWTSLVFENPAGLTALAELNVNYGQLTDFQKRFHSEQPGDVAAWLVPTLTWVPATAAMAAVLRVPPGAFLNEMARALDRDAQDLLQEGLRRSGIRGGLAELVDKVAPGLEPWVGIVFRNNDYPKLNLAFKVYAPSPAAAVALILRASRGQQGRVEDFIKLFREKLRYNLEFNGTGTKLPAGPGDQLWIQEWGNRHIPATGQIALMFEAEGSERYFLLSNSGQLVREMVNAHYGLRGSRPLATTPSAAESLRQLPDTVSGFCWVQGDRCRNILDRYQQFTRRQNERDSYDQVWAKSVRPGIEDEIFSRRFHGRHSSKAQLRGAALKQFETLVEQRLTELWKGERARRGADDERDFADAEGWLQYLEAAYLVVRARPKDLRLEARIFPRW